MFFKLFGNMLGQCCPLVEHDSQQTDYFQITVHIGMNLLDRVDQIGQTFESIIFALHRDDDTICRTERIQGQEGQGRRTIDENVVVSCLLYTSDAADE